MNVLIIDDHKINRLYLRNLIAEHFPVIKHIDEAGTVSESLRLIDVIDYTIIFLDMELGDGVGFDVLKEVKDFVYVIIVSCHKEYAIEAFKHSVIDYILKPINVNELKNAVKKVIKLHTKSEILKNLNAEIMSTRNKEEEENGLMINFKNEYVAIAKKDILFIKALGKYSEIHVVGKKQYTSYKNLKEFENAMPGELVRIHHSYLVNIKSIVSYSRDTSHVLLTNDVEIPVSVRKKEELFKKFKVF
jgi:two-component system, LytTR family, response regulator